MDIPIVYEDQELLIINKPPGVIVNRADTVKTETVQDWAAGHIDVTQFHRTEETKDFFDRMGIVHRIDKETSGLLILAKSPEAFTSMQAQFKDRTISKTYVAIAHGKVVPSEGEIRAPVGRLPWNKERFGIVPGGKDSVTLFRVTKVFQAKDDEVYSLVELHPETGRTHQIRVHLKYIEHPLLGDYLYAGRKTSRDDRSWASRVMLHAWKLTARHPTRGEEVAFEAPIPDDMNSIIASGIPV